MNTIRVVEDTQLFPEIRRVYDRFVDFCFDLSITSHDNKIYYKAVMISIETSSDDLIEIKNLALPSIKEYRIKLIREYDKSKNIEEFTYNGVSMWLDKNTRAGLKMRFDAEEAEGNENTTLWYNNQSFTLPISDAKNMLNALEVYASKCYDKTEEHIATINSINNADQVINFDITSGYPNKLIFK